MNYKIEKFIKLRDNEDNDNITGVRIGILTTLDVKIGQHAQSLIIDRELEHVEGKTAEEYFVEAYDSAKDEINEWAESVKSLGRTFNPETGEFGDWG